MERKRRARDGWMACDEGSETRETRVGGKTDGTRRRARAGRTAATRRGR